MSCVLDFPVDRCVLRSSNHVYSRDCIFEDAVNSCLVESQVFSLEKDVIPGNHLVLITCPSRCVACVVNYSELFLKSHDRKLSRKEEKSHLLLSYPGQVFLEVLLCT